MRLTVTPIGAAGASAAAVSAAVVNYLEGARGDPGAALFSGLTAGAAAYYADSTEGPGRWCGAGAAFQRLHGTVEPEAFQRVLEGRHPVTGARLLTARGSSQRQHLATGTAARFDTNGEALYEVADVARLLGVARSDVEELIDAGRDGDDDRGDSGWLASIDTADGPFVPDVEITRYLELAATPPTAAAVLADGDLDDLLSVPQVAQLLRVTPRYVRRLCEQYHQSSRGADRGRAALPNERRERASTYLYLVRRADVAAFADQRRPAVARVGFDVTLTCEKSFGLLAVLSAPDQQAKIVRAIRIANETAIEHLDRVASVGRRSGVAVPTEGLVVASYFHGTSRALDPHPHHHNVVANAVVDENGDVRALDARALYRHAPAAAALATAAARWELRELGLGWWRRDDGVWEVAGIDERAIREFSRRRTEMDEVRTALEERLGRSISHREEDTVALASRRDKEVVDVSGLVAGWRQRADQVGLDVGLCFGRTHDRPISYEVLPDRVVRVLFEDLVDPNHGLCATSNTFDRGDVLRAVTDWAIPVGDGEVRKVLLPPQEVERLADRFCASTLVAELDPDVVRGVIRRRDGSTVDDGQHEPVYATVELLQVQAEIVNRYRDGLAVGAGRLPTEPQFAQLAPSIDGVELSDEQQVLLRSWCTSGHRVQAAVGRAGTGKTTTMRAAELLWRRSGYRVVGCAVKAEAARQLAVEAGIEADTVALLLARADRGQRVLDSRTVLVVDEASTIGDRDLLALMRLSDAAGATIRLIGDTAQHGSVSAGGSFAQLVELGGEDTPHLTEVRRLRDPAERRRAELVRSGRIMKALAELQSSGQLVLTESDAATYAAMLMRWYEYRRHGEAHPMVHGRNRERRLLNQLAQAVLAADRTVDLDNAVTLRDGRRLAVGDDVIARHGDRRIHPPGHQGAWMRNGTTGRIVAIHRGQCPDDDHVIVQTMDGLLDCPRSVFDRRRGGLDLGYAVTSYAVQGSTRSASTSALTASTARSELYVDITRGRDSNQLYATRRIDDTNFEAHLPRIENELVPTLQGRLARGTVRTARALDPDALEVAELRRCHNLISLLAARRSGETARVGQAITRTMAAVRRQARNAPPGVIRRVLPPRPRCPHLAIRWDRAAGAVAVHLASTTPARRPEKTSDAVTGVLGPRPSDQQPAEHWDFLAAHLTGLAVDITMWNLRHHYSNDPQALDADWIRLCLENLASAGKLASLDTTAVAALIGDIRTWRCSHGIDESDLTTVVGTEPAERAERARYEHLTARLYTRPRSSGGRSAA